jgi:hypothetical protein
MQSFWTRRRVALGKTEVSKEHSASILRVTSLSVFLALNEDMYSRRRYSQRKYCVKGIPILMSFFPLILFTS